MLMIAPETGELREGNANIKVDMDLTFERKSVRANGELGVRIRRTTPAPRK
jgi:hypothetical protein